MKQSPENKVGNNGRFLQLFFGVGLLLLSISHWFPLNINLLELLGAFAHFTFAMSLLFVVVSVILKARILLGASVASALIVGSLVVPHFLPSELNGNADFTVGQFNVYHNNPSPNEAIDAIKASEADVFSIQELNSDWKELVDAAFSESHPFKAEEHWDNCCYGLGFYSRFPIISIEKRHFETLPLFDAQVLLGNDTTRLICIHTQAPAFPDKTPERDAQMELVAESASTYQTAIVFGDLNIVSWDGKFQRFLELGKLQSVRSGLQPTYPMDYGIPLIPIDHITYKGNLQPSFCSSVELPGSDHVGMVAGFALKD